MFAWGRRSRQRMECLHPDIKRVLDRFIQITPIDCTIIETSRTIQRQAELVKSGSSMTMNSRHIKGSDGFVKAADVAPLDGNRVSWSWPLYFRTAEAMRDAAIECSIPIRWGGVWKILNDIEVPLEQAVAQYVASCRAKNRKPFIDGPHNELPVEFYP